VEGLGGQVAHEVVREAGASLMLSLRTYWLLRHQCNLPLVLLNVWFRDGLIVKPICSVSAAQYPIGSCICITMSDLY
jgi:hypothetical protein